MPYRDHAQHAPQPPPIDPRGSLLALDVSGRRGHDGAPGAAGYSGGTGEDGGRGGDAGPAQIGQSAGRISIHLAAGASGEHVLVEADVTQPGGAHERVERELDFDEGGFIDLLARGGDGGDGGHGGSGGDGGHGAAGSNATRYSSGGNGGSGGDGGDGGNGTSGASGGAGGRVEVEVSADDTHLFMLLRTEVRGGAGGAAGVNGAGGSGGAGGPGGSSYSWTETQSYTDSQGHTQTRSTHHFNPGGSAGPSGSPGRSGSARLHPGADGPGGRLELVVRDASGSAARYDDRYRLRLVSYEHVSANDDGIYEPGERVEVKRLRVANVGGMPTPPNHDVRLTLDSEGWVWPDAEAHLLLPRALPAGEIAEVPGSLFFTIQDWVPEEPAPPLLVEDTIFQSATLPAAHREFERYQRPDDEAARYTIRFPIELSTVESLLSLAPGEASRVRFAVRNVSTRAFGTGSELGRAIRVRVFPHESELGGAHVCLFDAHDRPVPFEHGWVIDVDRLEPGETRTFEGTVAITGDAPFFREARFCIALELGKIGEPASPRPIQYGAFGVRVARRYRQVIGAELLVVIGHHTTLAQVEAWERLASSLGLSMTTWDPSIEGHFDPLRDLGSGSLADHLRGGTIAFASPPITTPMGAVWPHRFLDRAQLSELAGAGIAVVIFGAGNDEVDLVRWLVPDDEEAPAKHHRDAAALQSALEEEEDGLSRVHESVDVHHVGFWWEAPSAARYRDRGAELSRRLTDAHPSRRFLVFCDGYAPEIAWSIGVIKRWKMGRWRVRTTLEPSRAHVVHASGAIGAAMLESPADPRGAALLLLARSFDEKLERLARAIRARKDGMPDAHALAVDLGSELRAVLASPWRSGLSRAGVRRALPLLRRLVERATDLAGPAPDDAVALPLIELAARLRYAARAMPRPWEWLLWPLRRATMLRSAVLDLTGELLERAFTSPSSASDDHTTDREARLEGAAKRVAERERAIAEAHAALLPRPFTEVLSNPLFWEGVTSDAELLCTAEDRVVDARRLDAIRASDRAEAEIREAVARAQQGARASLLRPSPLAPSEREGALSSSP